MVHTEGSADDPTRGSYLGLVDKCNFRSCGQNTWRVMAHGSQFAKELSRSVSQTQVKC